ncbi:MAG: O-antigen ligase family protein [Candidatus Azambacteria bacterium]|nr:O-antigen ligase family protein [Candidatus Azambacteria bacterium]
MSKFDIYLSRIVTCGLYAILLTPLAFYPKALFGFLTPKFIFFQILVEIVFGAWLILAVLNKEYRPKFSWLLTTIAIFAGVSLISALFGVDFSRSFWGIGARMTGLFAEFHFLAWFLVLISVSKFGNVGLLKPDFDIVKYLNFSFAIALVVALTAFYQNPRWGLSLGYTVFNNPTFAAPYFIFHFFWGLYRFIEVGLLYSRRLYFLGGSALIAVAIVLSQIRGAILGLIAGIIVFWLGLILFNIISKRKRVVLAGIFIFIAAVFIFFWSERHSEFIKNIGFLSRLTQTSFLETTAQTRFSAWRIALGGFKDRSLLGTGPENFNILFNAHYNPELLKYGIGETWFDKPHNAFLEILTETGIAGSLAYLAIWVAVGLELYRLFKRGKKFLSLITASTFVAYFGALSFSFDSFGSWFGLFLFLAFLASRGNSLIPRIEESAEGGGRILGINRKFTPFIVSVAIFVIFLVLTNYSIWRANISDADALRIFPKDTEQGMALFKKSLNYFTPYKAEYQLDMLTALGSAIQTNYLLPNPEETINFALNEADKIIIFHPNDAAYYTNLLKIYNIFGEKDRNPVILNIAESYGKKSLELSPKRQETLFYITKTFLLKGDTNFAVIYMLQAVAAAPSINSSHWYLGLAYIADNQKEKGQQEIKKAIELGYAPQNSKEKDFIKNLGL